MFPGPGLLYPPLHDFRLLIRIYPSFSLVTPKPHSAPCLVPPLSLSVSPPHPSASTLSFCPSQGLSPSSLICLHPSNPHLFLIGPVYDGEISQCVCDTAKSGRAGESVLTELMTTSRRSLLEDAWLKICQNSFRGAFSLVSGRSCCCCCCLDILFSVVAPRCFLN